MTAAMRRIMIMTEMHGRDLMRRHAALALLVALPLCFFLASMGSGTHAVVAGGVGMAFSVSGATLFSVLSSEEVDQRLVLGGYRPLHAGALSDDPDTVRTLLEAGATFDPDAPVPTPLELAEELHRDRAAQVLRS